MLCSIGEGLPPRNPGLAPLLLHDVGLQKQIANIRKACHRGCAVWIRAIQLHLPVASELPPGRVSLHVPQTLHEDLEISRDVASCFKS